MIPHEQQIKAVVAILKEEVGTLHYNLEEAEDSWYEGVAMSIIRACEKLGRRG